MYELGKHVPLIVLRPPPEADVDDTPRPSVELPPQLGHGSPVVYLTSPRPVDQPADQAAEERLPLSFVRPTTPSALRTMLYRSPHAIATLRREAIELFLQSTEAVASASGSGSTIDEAIAAEHGRTVDLGHTRRWLEQTRDESELSLSEMDVGGSQTLERTLRARDVPFVTRRPAHPRSMTRGTIRAGGRGRARGAERRRSTAAPTRPAVTAPSLADSPLSPSTSVGLQSPTRNKLGLSSSQHAPSTHGSLPAYANPATFDPLHIPSLIRLALEGLILSPLRVRLARFFMLPRYTEQERGAGAVGAEQRNDAPNSLSERREQDKGGSLVPFALVAGAFCAGVGVGILLARSYAAS